MLFTLQDLPACCSRRDPELIEPLRALLNMEVCFTAGQVCETDDRPPFSICAGGCSLYLTHVCKGAVQAQAHKGSSQLLGAAPTKNCAWHESGLRAIAEKEQA